MSDSESKLERKRTFKMQLHPIVDSIVIHNLDGETTAKDILDKYAAETAKKFHCKESDVRDSLNGIIPFTPVKHAPDESARPSFIVGKYADIFIGYGVGQGALQTARLKNMYKGEQNNDEINKGLCLVSVSAQHPHFRLVQLYGNEQERNAMLEAKVADLEKAMTEQAPLQGKFYQL